MKPAFRIVFTTITSLFLCITLHSQDLFPENAPIYRDDVVSRVDITIPVDSLAIIFAPGNEESDYHFHATFVFDNGMIRDTFENVGFRLRGNTSRYSAKKSFKVSLNTYASGRTWYGVEKLNLNSEHNDPTVSRSKICWDLLRAIGVPAPRASHVELFVNGVSFGVYANIEHIDEEFVNTRFGNKDGNLYKCLWPADLVYLGSDPDFYKLTNGNRRVYELGTNESADDYTDLANFIDILNKTPIGELPCALEPVFNINSFLLSMAFDILSGNWDGPLYNKNNFYLYHNTATGQFEYIPYDLDNTFGIDWFGIDWAHRDIYSWGHPDEPRPIYSRILQVPEYRDRLSYDLNKIITTVYKEAVMFPRIDSLKALIESYVANDVFYPLDYGFDIQDFEDGFGQSLPFFHTPVGIKPFIASRRSATLTQLQLHDISPIISGISYNHPDAFHEIELHASAEDDQGIATMEVCYQFNGGGDINCIQMSDDGEYPDDIPGDGRYAVLIPPAGMASVVTFQIRATDLHGNVAQDPVCGMRQLSVGNAIAALAVNEFMASNATTVTDEADEYEDWVEIYNYGTDSIFLGDLYLSDNENNPTKWRFPEIWILPDEYVLIWADDEADDGPLHASFKLSAGGEYIGIFDSDAQDNILIDGLEFGPQVTDAAFGRLPNGTGPFQVLHPTPGSANEALSVVTVSEPGLSISAYPNPVHDVCYVKTNVIPGGQFVVLFDLFGNVILQKPLQQDLIFDLRQLPNAVYFFGIVDQGRIMRIHKVIKG